MIAELPRLPVIALVALGPLAHPDLAQIQGSQDTSPDDPPALIAVDGKPVAPGRIPEGTTEEAIGLWNKFTAADPEAEAVPLHSFDLSFEVQVREPGKFNEIHAAIRFLKGPRGPYLDASFERKNRRSVRGPRGDFLVEDGDAQPMVGLDFEEDRLALDRWCALSNHFLTLSQPERLGLISLQRRDLAKKQPAALASNLHAVEFTDIDALMLPTAKLAAQARGLDWLDLKTPDFRLYRPHLTAGEGNAQRALLGLDHNSGEVRMAVLSEEIQGAIVLESALLVLVPRYSNLGTIARVPAELEVRQVDPQTSPWTFEQRSGTVLFLKRGGQLNPPDLSPAAFIPKRP